MINPCSAGVLARTKTTGRLSVVDTSMGRGPSWYGSLGEVGVGDFLAGTPFSEGI